MLSSKTKIIEMPGEDPVEGLDLTFGAGCGYVFPLHDVKRESRTICNCMILWL